MRCVAAQIPLDSVNITNTTDAIQKIIDLSSSPSSTSSPEIGVGGRGGEAGLIGSKASLLSSGNENNEELDLCNRLHKFYHCLLNLVNEECLINRVYVTYFNEIEIKLREFKCKQTSGNRNLKFYYYFKTRFSSEFNDDEDDALDGKLT